MNPDEFTNQELMLDVGDGHSIYVQDWGNLDAPNPIVFLHGGPGNGVSDKHKSRFDPSLQRVIFHDQRGAGKSTPYGSLEHNTTAELVEDIEKIATRLKLGSFILTGGSWGSTLALAYALKYPERVKTMVLQGVFTGSSREFSYLLEGRYETHFPDVRERFVKSVPAPHQDNPLDYHIGRLIGDDPAQLLESAMAIQSMEGSLLSLDDRVTPMKNDEYDPVPITIETYYTKNLCFMPDNYLLDNAHNLTMPVWIVQGRYDFVCPPITAYELHRKLPDSQLIWTVAGHGNDRNNYEVMRTLLLRESLT